MGASATNCRHTPACVRVRAQVPCLYGAALQWWPALSRLCGARCRQTCCGATVAAVHSFETPHAHAGVTRVRAFTRAQLCPTPCTQRTLPHTRPARAALRRPRRRSDRRPVLSLVRRSFAQVLRLVAVGAVSASRSAARAPGAPVRSAVRSAARCGRRRRAIKTLVASGYRPAPETPLKQPSSRAHRHTRRASREQGRERRSSQRKRVSRARRARRAPAARARAHTHTQHTPGDDL